MLSLAPETNGNVAVKAWDALGKITGRDHKHLAEPKHEERIRFTTFRHNAQDYLFTYLVWPGG
ncbi:MAG: hypothetical protein R3E73_13215 [Porticoccaceae bacterium]